MESWDTTQIEAPDGTRDPVVLRSVDGALRAVLLVFEPGQELGDHETREDAVLVVLSGSVRVAADGHEVEGGPGSVFAFGRGERHAVASPEGARAVLVLAPWPAPDHYVGSRPHATAA
jgi:quercetin dioxygenase-like cupin family protein